MSVAPFDRPGSRWFTIPAHRPFARDLAEGLHRALDDEAMARAVVLLPTRRAARAVADELVAAGGGRARLLPQLRAFGDLDEGEPPFEPGDLAVDLPPAIGGRVRRFELARLAADHAALLGRDLDAAAALELGDALGGFFDSLQLEEIDPSGRFEGLVDAAFAAHWALSARFLEAATGAWSARLADLGLIDASARRVALLRALTESWTNHPPGGVVVVAGSTGSAPATADFLIAAAGLPRGAVVLPGLDEGLDERAWVQVDEQHPQGAMKRLLDRAGLTRASVDPWLFELDVAGRWRRRIVNEALRPAQSTADWLKVIDRLRDEAKGEAIDPFVQGLAGLSLVAADHDEAAADACALLLRETLETPGATADLITPDRALARRVSARLARWGIKADVSAGSPLSGCPAAVLAQHVAELGADPLSPVRLLAVLKHPITTLGLEAADLAERREVLERHALRGPRALTAEGLLGRLTRKPHWAPAADLLRRALAAIDLAAAVFAEGPASPNRAAQGLAQALETLAEGGDSPWAEASGEALAALVADLIDGGARLPAVDAARFAALLSKLLSGETIRAAHAHPRIRILGALEARLVGADRLILGGLEEGVWPQAPPVDPFLSRPMRERLGLPSPERRVGLSAHDFAQGACAPQVTLVHALKREGSPAVESRWLWRLKMLLAGAGVQPPTHPALAGWIDALDAPGAYAPVGQAAHAPPLEARPTRYFVTQVETLTRDPYALWARRILDLHRLAPPDERVDSRLRGTAIHSAFERFAEGGVHDAATFEALYLGALIDLGLPPEAMAREAALARETALWAADWEAARRADGRRILVEQAGHLPLTIAGRAYRLSAKADRIELTPDGFAHVLDFKTGSPPSAKQIDAGFSPQLTLTAAILAGGGFEGVSARPAGDLTYVRVTGRRPAGQEIVRKAAGGDSADAADKALAGLISLLARYADEALPYRSRTAPQFAAAPGGDYDHLARVFEWSTGADAEEGE